MNSNQTATLNDLEQGDEITVRYTTSHGNDAEFTARVQSLSEFSFVSDLIDSAVVWDPDEDRRYRLVGTREVRVLSLRSGSPRAVGHSGTVLVEDDAPDEPVTVREEETVEGYDLPDAPEEVETDGGTTVEGATDEDVRLAVEVAEAERLAAESERARELEREQRNATPADLYPDGGEVVEVGEFDEGDRVHVVAQPLNRHADPVEASGEVEENTEDSLLFDTGPNRYRITAGGSLYRVPSEEEDPRGFEELLGTVNDLYAVEEAEA